MINSHEDIDEAALLRDRMGIQSRDGQSSNTNTQRDVLNSYMAKLSRSHVNGFQTYDADALIKDPSRHGIFYASKY